MAHEVLTKEEAADRLADAAQGVLEGTLPVSKWESGDFPVTKAVADSRVMPGRLKALRAALEGYNQFRKVREPENEDG